MTDESSKLCPACAEEIRVAALVCRYCGHRFPGAESLDRQVFAPSSQPPPSVSRVTPDPTRRSSGPHRLNVRLLIGGASAVVLGWAALTWGNEVVRSATAGSSEIPVATPPPPAIASPEDVVLESRRALLRGDLNTVCTALTGAGQEELHSAALRAVESSGLESGEDTFETLNALEKAIEEEECTAPGEVLMDMPFPGPDSIEERIFTDGGSAVQDVDLRAGGDEATVTTGAGVWVLNEVGGRWLISSVPYWQGLALSRD